MVGIDNNFTVSIKVLREKNFEFFVNNGTLLGIVRDGHLIEWDSDIDIALLGNCSELRRAQRELERVGFKSTPLNYAPGPPSTILERAGGRRLDIGLLRTEHIDGRDWAVRRWYRTSTEQKAISARRALQTALLSLMYKMSFSCENTLRGTESRPRQGRFFPCHLSIRRLQNVEVRLRRALKLSESTGYFAAIDAVLPLVETSFGGMTVPIPNNPTSVLRDIYGVDWKTPIESKHWSQFTRGSAPAKPD